MRRVIIEGDISMDTELKRKWVDALRSGEFKQGEGKLRTKDNRYCCLGVLCTVQGRKFHRTLDNNWAIGSGEEEDIGGDCNRKLAADVGGIGIVDELVSMNDGTNDEPKHTFDEIADWIEENL